MEFHEGMDLDLGSSGIDGVDSESLGMNGMSGYPSKKPKTVEEQVNFDKMPLLSCICKMDYLLRTFGEKVKFDQETVSGKYILFYCFFYQLSPVDVMHGYSPMDLFKLCADLYSVRDDFEMVVVPKPGVEDKYDLCLKAFFSFVPTYSLVVPAKESHRRNFMCDCLGLVYPGTFKCVLVNVKKGILVHGGFYSMLHLIGRLQKLQKESSFDCLRSYERILKTLWPVIPKEQKNPFPPIQACPIAYKLMGVKLEYGDHINEMVSESKKLSPIKIGQSFDAISFLSGKDDMNYLCRNDDKTGRVEIGKQTFSGKYILVCCFHLPVFRQEFNARRAQALATACSELYSSRSDFEMVVVAKMNQLANHEVFFDHFMSGFPPSCLVVPFQHSEHRDFICKYLDLAASECDDIKCLILDKDTDIKRNILYCEYPYFALDHGADAFPFTDKKLKEVSANDHLWRDDGHILPSKLEDLLGCSPSDVLNKTVSPGVHEKVTILELSSKVVGVYACFSGHLIPTLGKVYQQCRAQGLDFEIVLVYIPWTDDSLDPEVHIANIESVLLEWNISWCWFPPCFDGQNKRFNSSVSCRFRRCTEWNHTDHIVIVGPHGAFVEPHGAEFMSVCGIDAYPFGRDGIIEMKMKKFEELTLETLLEYGPRKYVYKDKKKIPVSELTGKKTLLYLDNLGDFGLSFQVKQWYFEIKQYLNPDVQLVLVRRHDYPVMGDEADLLVSETAPFWYVCPFDPRHSTWLEEELFIGGLQNNAIVAFGSDGRVCSLGALGRLWFFGPKGLEFDKSDLRQNVLDELISQGRTMCAWPGPMECFNLSS